MKKIINYLFPVKSQWFDAGLFEDQGTYKLIQFRLNYKNNKKTFRVASMGFVNDDTQKETIYKNVLSINKSK